MSTYALGFNDGERQAWTDRRFITPRVIERPLTEYERGFRDGYLPRDPAWRLRTKPVPSWQERAEA
jgi:hypothetical protein